MSRKLVSFVALLCFLAISNSAIAHPDMLNWSAQANWNGTTPDWFTASNWGLSDANYGATPPDLTTWAPIGPTTSPAFHPVINGDAVCGMLSISPWSWGGAPDGEVDVNSGTCDFSKIEICTSGFDSSTQGKGILMVYGGTVTTQADGTEGITIGSQFGPSAGRVIMYGGLISVPKVSLYNGDIALYGGTLECTGDSNFIFSQAQPQNKIDISGGTLQCTGNYNVSSPNVPALIAGGLIYSSRGTVGTPVYDSNANTTTLSCVPGSVNMNIPWGPSPANGATNVHYRTGDVNTGITLQWNSGSEPNVINHDVYFGTNANIINSVYGDANFVTEVNEANEVNGVQVEPNSWLLGTYAFKINTNYYWRVDDNQITVTYDANSNPVSSYTTLIKGPVWTFRSHDGKASNPLPYNGRVGLAQPLALQWTKGDFAVTHRVYIGTDAGSLTSDHGTSTSTKTYRGTVTTPLYSLSNLATNWFGPLVAGNTYYWKVAEVNGTTVWGGGLSDYQLWNFTPTAFMTIDDFQDYNSTADINNANWSSGYDVTVSCNDDGVSNPNGNMTFVVDADGKHGNFWYKDRGAAYFSEERKSYSNISGGTIFAGNTAVIPSFAALRIDYKGAAINAIDPIYDRMYAAIEDTAGNIGVVPNPDPTASQAISWTSWYIALSDPNFTSVNLAHVKNFYLGFGKRCNDGTVSSIPGTTQDGNVMFDNLSLYAKTCNPAFAPAADLDGDCDVDINDLAIFAESWLNKAQLLTFTITAPQAPVLWYKFNDGTGTSITDYGKTGSYTGTVISLSSSHGWDTTGGRDANHLVCLNLPSGQNSYVSCPPSALSFMSDANHIGDDAQDGGGVTFSVWLKANVMAPEFQNWGATIIIGNALSGEASTIACPYHNFGTWGWAGWWKNESPIWSWGPDAPLADFGPHWNHWVFVKEPHAISFYCNGNLIGHEADTDANQSGGADAYIYGPLFTPPATSFAIGTRWWAWWAGEIADFRVYDYALNANEVDYLTTDGTGQLLIPLFSSSNLNLDGGTAGDVNQIVNFTDLAVMGLQWHTQQLWP